MDPPLQSLAIELTSLLGQLGVRGILTLLGMQCTTGSIDAFPPRYFSPSSLLHFRN
jgi:hypothetical protein